MLQAPLPFPNYFLQFISLTLFVIFTTKPYIRLLTESSKTFLGKRKVLQSKDKNSNKWDSYGVNSEILTRVTLLTFIIEQTTYFLNHMEMV